MDQLLSFLEFSFALVNLPYTLLVCVVLLYWISVIIGALDIDLFHFDLDVNADMEMDLDADLDTDMDAGADGDAQVHGDSLRSVLLFFNLGDVPVMIMVSVLCFFMWNISMLFTYYTGNQSLLMALAVFIPNFLGSLFIAKFVTHPFRILFRALGRDTEQAQDLMGKSCIVTTSQVDAAFGQAKIETEGAPLLLNARTEDGEILKKGEEALVVSYDPKKSIAIIKKF